MSDAQFRHFVESNLDMDLLKVYGEGDKFYEALSLWKFGTEARALDLRQAIISELIDNQDLYSKFLKNASFPDTLLKIHNNELIAGKLELCAASRALKINIHLYQPLSASPKVYPPNIKFEKKVYLAYHNNCTFSLILPRADANLS